VLRATSPDRRKDGVAPQGYPPGVRSRSEVVCSACGARQSRWVGRCPACGAWNTLEAQFVSPGRGARREVGPSGAVRADSPGGPEVAAEPTGFGEIDRVLGGGLVEGSVTLLFGEPGIGKSTLALQLAGLGATRGGALVVSAEESLGQLRRRAVRCGVSGENLWLAAARDLETLAHLIETTPADLCVVDSVQAVVDEETTGQLGGVNQVRVVATTLADVARRLRRRLVLVSQVTKDGTLAGPRALEHLVDTVLAIEGDRHHALRVVRALKHRHGSTGEVGLLEMGGQGLVAVADPAELLLGDRLVGTSGSAVTPASEGGRAFLVEVQALVADAATPTPRRVVQGLDAARVAVVLAVLERRLGLRLSLRDVFVSAVGGMRVTEPAVDLAIAAAVVSAATERALPGDGVVVGEVGLAGEVRRVPGLERRLAEVGRAGFHRAVLPSGAPSAPSGVEVVAVRTLAEAIEALGLGTPAGGLATMTLVPAGARSTGAASVSPVPPPRPPAGREAWGRSGSGRPRAVSRPEGAARSVRAAAGPRSV